MIMDSLGRILLYNVQTRSTSITLDVQEEKVDIEKDL